MFDIAYLSVALGTTLVGVAASVMQTLRTVRAEKTFVLSLHQMGMRLIEEISVLERDIIMTERRESALRQRIQAHEGKHDDARFQRRLNQITSLREKLVSLREERAHKVEILAMLSAESLQDAPAEKIHLLEKYLVQVARALPPDSRGQILAGLQQPSDEGREEYLKKLIAGERRDGPLLAVAQS